MKRQIDPVAVFDRLSEGDRPKDIAAAMGMHYVSVRSAIRRHVKAMGCRTTEQAIAIFAREKVKEEI